MNTKQNPEVRCFEQKKDLKKAMELNKIALPKPTANSSERLEISPEHMQTACLEGKGDFIVVYLGKELVAMGGIRKKDRRTAVINGLKVHPQYIGSSITESLRNGLEERARQLEYRKIMTEVKGGNEIGQVLCEKLGFHTVNMITKDGADFFILEKELK
ncbi:hypothetical protein COV61_00945 [Candidatus Micrarchaeota archaeon CG11_big_fil_rev_8_21_14_0_20_47_5]|nr:MAG: hypothetical protein AUJ17_01095 [Candidatus Micrarchaeota archaeon CG1_02_47_40]PIN84167.1 MAG: hypothetical protein COV61_00945 [Candidatus Micrarchaeota archaeon CG11_big_fil_rev_8_21_14_0_20_47_5]